MNQAIKDKILKFYSDNKEALDDAANYLGCPAIWLVCFFYNESGLNSHATNSIGAAGLNQMLPATLQQYGITSAQYAAGSVAYQLGIMKKFFSAIRGRIKRAADLYLFNFFPAAVINNYSMDYAIGEAGNFEVIYGMSKDKIYQQNKGLDYNKDGKITRKDFTDGFEAKYDELVKGNFFFKGPTH